MNVWRRNHEDACRNLECIKIYSELWGVTDWTVGSWMFTLMPKGTAPNWPFVIVPSNHWIIGFVLFSFYPHISVIYKLTMFTRAFGETRLPWLSEECITGNLGNLLNYEPTGFLWKYGSPWTTFPISPLVSCLAWWCRQKYIIPVSYTHLTLPTT